MWLVFIISATLSYFYPHFLWLDCIVIILFNDDIHLFVLMHLCAQKLLTKYKSLFLCNFVIVFRNNCFRCIFIYFSFLYHCYYLDYFLFWCSYFQIHEMIYGICIDLLELLPFFIRLLILNSKWIYVAKSRPKYFKTCKLKFHIHNFDWILVTQLFLAM